MHMQCAHLNVFFAIEGTTRAKRYENLHPSPSACAKKHLCGRASQILCTGHTSKSIYFSNGGRVRAIVHTHTRIPTIRQRAHITTRGAGCCVRVCNPPRCRPGLRSAAGTIFASHWRAEDEDHTHNTLRFSAYTLNWLQF